MESSWASPLFQKNRARSGFTAQTNSEARLHLEKMPIAKVIPQIIRKGWCHSPARQGWIDPQHVR